jgi:glycosyltransferase involved in cell wall biosynthesis
VLRPTAGASFVRAEGHVKHRHGTDDAGRRPVDEARPAGLAGAPLLHSTGASTEVRPQPADHEGHRELELHEDHEHGEGAYPAREAPERPMRIALVISSLSGGGAERVLSTLAGYWARGGHDVTVVTVGSRETDVYALGAGVRRVTLDLARPSRHVVEALVRSSRRVFALRRALVRLEPDVVVSFIASANVLSLLATSGTGVSVVVCERTDPRRHRIGMPRAALRRLLYPRAAGLVVQTESLASWGRDLCSRVHVIPNFVERPHISADPGNDRGGLRLMAMGSLRPEKGFDLLIEAFARIAASHPQWSLTILGDGPERLRLDALVASARLQDRVSMPGRTSEPWRHLAAAHAFALSSRREGFPNALLEAMASGLPVVAFDCPSGPAEIIEHGRNGLLVEAGDVSRLAAALDRIMSSPEERARIGESAREIAVRLAPERILPRWDAVVLRVGGDRTSRNSQGRRAGR